ncbi:10490_t:CDS:2, partial [Scutellospora calospora]
MSSNAPIIKKKKEATAKPCNLKKHLAYECKNVDSETRIKVLHLLSHDFVDSDNDTALTSTTKTSKRQKLNEYENILTSLSKEDQINKILLKNSTLYATYPIPSRWIVSNMLLDQELVYVNIKVERIINNEVNLTIAID